jgi:hypothetical protein
MARRAAPPTDLMFALAALWFETSWTIALRTAQLWSAPFSAPEWARMAAEKPKAFGDAAVEASGAWARSLTRPARRNRRRLSRKKLR